MEEDPLKTSLGGGARGWPWVGTTRAMDPTGSYGGSVPDRARSTVWAVGVSFAGHDVQEQSRGEST